MSALFCRIEQTPHLLVGEEVLAPNVGINRPTLTISTKAPCYCWCAPCWQADAELKNRRAAAIFIAALLCS